MNVITIEHEAFQQIANRQGKVERSPSSQTHQSPSKPINLYQSPSFTLSGSNWFGPS